MKCTYRLPLRVCVSVCVCACAAIESIVPNAIPGRNTFMLSIFPMS